MPSQARLGSVIRSAAAPEVVMARVVEQAVALIRAAEGSAVELSDGPTMSYVAAFGSLAFEVDDDTAALFGPGGHDPRPRVDRGGSGGHPHDRLCVRFGCRFVVAGVVCRVCHSV